LGAQAHLTASNCDTLFLPLTYSPNASWNDIHLPKVLRRSDRVRSAIVTGSNSENLLRALRNQDIHFAVLGNNILGEYERGCYDTVFSDDVGGAYEMTRHLLSLDHRDIWFVGNDRLPWFARCHEGYARAMEEAGLIPRASGFDSEDDQVTGYLGMKSIISRSDPATAIVSCTDAVALGVYKALAEYRIRIPDDISVVGCNDTYAPLLNPPLTTVCEFPEHLGKRLAEVVLRRMREPDRAAMEITVPTQLIKRESCARLAPSSEQSHSRQRGDELSMHQSI
jgi:LacI family transcriptional regulator